jgi:integrase
LNKPYQNFLDRLDSKEPQTKQKYIKDIRYYLQFLNVKDPNLLISKKFYTPQETQKIEDKIVSYITFLKKQELSHNTIKGRKSAIEFFYVANRINLNWKHISGYIPRPTQTRQDIAYSIEDIQKMLNVATSERDRFLIYLLSSTGMRIGALTDLKYGNIEPVKPEGYQGKYLYKIIVYKGHRLEYYTFTSFECAEALDSYIEYRRRMGEIITDNSPLLRNPVNSNLAHVKKPNKVKPVKTFVHPIYRITQKAGLRTRTHNRQTQHKHMLDHAFRKFTISQMEKANMKYEAREFLTAHKTSRGLDNNYLRMSVEDRLTEYLKVIPYLTISQEHVYREKYMEADLTANQKLESLRKEKDRELQDMKEKYESEVESIREETNQKFNQIMTMIQQNPQLAQIKPEILTSKKASSAGSK